MNIGGKKIYKSKIKLQRKRYFRRDERRLSPCRHRTCIQFRLEAGRHNRLSWRPSLMSDIPQKRFPPFLLTSVTSSMAEKPGDDATACVVKIRKRVPMNMLFGPPRNRDDCNRMMSLFFSKEGKHIVCGGTTSSIAAKYLGKAA